MNYAGSFERYRGSAHRHIDVALPFVDGRRVAVQAGGHVGQFPVYLAQHFQTVYTWEPTVEHFVHLVHNLEIAGVSDRVFAMRGFLGRSSGLCSLRTIGDGANRRSSDKEGAYLIYILDDLKLPVCDLIYLDVEGDELEILHGAVETIRRCRPVISAEEKAKFVNVGELGSFVGGFGYRQVASYGADLTFKFQGTETSK